MYEPISDYIFNEGEFRQKDTYNEKVEKIRIQALDS